MEIREYRTYCQREILPLYASVGWTFYTEFPDYQRKGIATALLQEVLRRFGHVRQIVLARDDAPKTISLYFF